MAGYWPSFFSFSFAFLLTKIKNQGGGPQVGEVNRFGRVTRLSIYSPAIWCKKIAELSTLGLKHQTRHSDSTSCTNYL